MEVLPIRTVPNQSFSITLDGVRYDLSLLIGNGIMTISIVRDGTMLIQGLKIIPNYPLIPYRYLSTEGNFFMLEESEEYPSYPEFDISQYLIYFSEEEIQELRGDNG